MLRGNSAQAVFFRGEDRERFYDLLAEGVRRFGHRIHGFCLMGNHVHLIVQVAEVELSRIMQNVAFRYTRWVNRREGRSGHLFQGRFQALLVDADAYLLELTRYVHLNPVRAGLVEDPAEYPWSGHRAYLGQDHLPWLHTERVLSQFGRSLGDARRRYREFVAAGVAGNHRSEFHVGNEDPRVLADDRFLERVLGKAAGSAAPPPLDAIIETVCRRYGVTPEALASRSRLRRLSKARALTGWLAVQTRAASLTRVAQMLQRDVATMSRMVGRIEEGYLVSELAAAELRELVKAITQA